MEEMRGTIRLAESTGEFGGRGLATTVSRAQAVQALQSGGGTVDLVIDVDRAVAPDNEPETTRLALSWERQDLERLLEENEDEITLTFDEAELRKLLDDDVEAHGVRKALAVLTVAAGMAAAGAGSAFAAPLGDNGPLPGGAAKHATTAQVSTSASDQGSWSTSETAGAAAAGAILGLTALGFVARSRRGPRVAT